MKVYRNFFNGSFVVSPSAPNIEVLNPSTEEVIACVPDTPAEQVHEAIAAAEEAQSAWGRLPAVQRAGYLRRIAQLVRGRAEHFVRIITEEQGKTLGLARYEVNAMADYLV